MNRLNFRNKTNRLISDCLVLLCTGVGDVAGDGETGLRIRGNQKEPESKGIKKKDKRISGSYEAAAN